MSTKISKKQLGEDILQMLEAAASGGQFVTLKDTIVTNVSQLPDYNCCFHVIDSRIGYTFVNDIIYVRREASSLVVYTINGSIRTLAVDDDGNLTETFTDETWALSSEFNNYYPSVVIDEMIPKVDTAMSDTSENPVQNKIIKAYVDEKAGSNDLINVDLDYAALQQSGSVELSQGLKIPFSVVESKGISLSQNGNPILKKGRSYHITFSLRIRDEGSSNNGARAMFALKDITNDITLITSGAVTKLQKYSNSIGNGVVTPSSDIEVGLFISYLEGSAYADNGNSRFLNSLIIQEIGRQTLIDPVTYLDQEEGLQDTPVGHILTHMGKKAPKHYLICDGTTYNVGTYPYLEQHFVEEFGSVNYFGGDGTSTFKVPDLRGEFLRGTGAGSLLYGGKGVDVGKHQNPTRMVNLRSDKNATYVTSDTNFTILPVDTDNIFGTQDERYSRELSIKSTTKQELNSEQWFTSRPTNTSVLYCIKYEPTYAIKVNEVNYSYEERRIGTWVDGKPLYEKVIDFGTLPNASDKFVPTGVTNADTIWINGGFVTAISATDGSNYVNQLAYADASTINSIWNFILANTDIRCRTGLDRSNSTAIIFLRYTKTTDQSTS